MNKPAPKEPSMDEILSSIRQIIADDDAAVAPRKPAAPGPAASIAPVPRPIPNLPPMSAPKDDAEPLALTSEQILREEAEAAGPMAPGFMESKDDTPTGDPQLVDPEDVAFEVEEAAPLAMTPPVVARPEPPVPPVFPRATSSFTRPTPSVSRAAPMPDPTLSRDMAEQLLAPTTNAAVKHTLNKLSAISVANAGVTLDGLIRDMLRPMLKEWLDENLPAVVERMVEKEISRISRGNE
jgi:cell pole-organizing protein PopZ